MKPLQNILLALAGLLLFGVPQIGFAFVDVNKSHPDYRPIMTLFQEGVIQGIEENGQLYFYPDRNINRAEFVTMIARAEGLEIIDIPEGERVFDDVYGPVWYASSVAAAKEAGLVNGHGDGDFFLPGDRVKYIEALKVVLLAQDADIREKIEREEWYQRFVDHASYYRIPIAGSLDTEINRAFMARLVYEASRRSEDYDIKENHEEGQASHYGEKFEGRGTASGETYDRYKFTAAHKTLPFGTWVKVTNLIGGKNVLVKINDRGPYADGRVIDLSPAAFEALAPLSRGVLDVSIETYPEPPEDLSLLPDFAALQASLPTPCPDQIPAFQSIDSGSFDNIFLEEGLSNLYLQNQVFRLAGQIEGDHKVVTSFLVDENGKQHVDQAQIFDQQFELFIHFPNQGTFKWGMLPGNGGSAKVKDIHVLPTGCIDESQTSDLPAPSEVSLSVDQGKTKLNWQGEGDLTKLTFSQNGQEITLISQHPNEMILPVKAFEQLSAGNVMLTVQNAYLQGESLFNSPQINWGQASESTFSATMHRQYEVDREKVELINIFHDDQTDLIQMTFDPKVPIQSEAALILPVGEVDRISMASPTHSPVIGQNAEVFPEAAQEVQLSYLADQEGVHVAEMNDADGLAAINFAFYPKNTFPLLPNPADLSDRLPVDLGTDFDALNQQMLAMVNELRLAHGRRPLGLDPTLVQAAQDRADDMALNNYFSHVDLNGNTINDTKGDYGISGPISENLAKETTLELAMFGFQSSAIHWENILEVMWEKGGFGFAKNNDGSYTMVQVFSAPATDFNDLESLRQTVLLSVNDRRTGALVLSDELNEAAQIWTDKMSEEGFFDYRSPGGETFSGVLEQKGIDESLGTNLLASGDFASVLENILNNEQLIESRWAKLGIGLSQDALGIKAMVIYSE